MASEAATNWEMDGRGIRPDEVLAYLCTRWRFIAIACGAATVLSFAASMAMTRQYTATVSIAIDPPAGSDGRTSGAISPIYLESLRAFEFYAGSDSLFEQAVEKFHLRTRETDAVELLKRRILKVTKVKDSKILQIRATLPDPRQAQDVAQFMAGETVKLSRTAAQGADRQVLPAAEQQLTDARVRYADALKAYTELSARLPVEGLQSEIESLQEVSSRTLRDATEAEADAEDYATREKTMIADSSPAEELHGVHQDAVSRKARAVLVRQQAKDMQAALLSKGAELSRNTAARKHFETELTIAQTTLEAGAARVAEIKAASGSRGEVLNIIDPGILPQRPSSPNVALNVVASFSIALITSAVYLTLSLASGVRYGKK
jgi:uncharacterized protein involved in exopolysaccharide biosynthesis